MKRSNETIIKQTTLERLYAQALQVIFTQQNSMSEIYKWDHQYLEKFLDHINTLLQSFNQQDIQNNKHIHLELFISKLIYIFPSFLQKGSRCFQHRPFFGNQNQSHSILLKLKILNILLANRRFPIEILNIKKSPSIHTQLQKIYWINCLKSLSRNELQDQYDQLLEQNTYSPENIENLRDFYLKLEEQKQHINYQTKMGSNYIRIRDFQPSPPNVLSQILKVEQFFIILSSEQEIPEQIFVNETIEIWIDKSIQYNSLIGNYICTQRYGEFKWMKGPLIYALQNGISLIMNNFQQASNELIVALKNIIKNGYLFVQNINKKIFAKLGFKIIGIANDPIQDIPFCRIPEKNIYEIIPPTIKEESRNYFISLFEQNKSIGYRKLFKLWRRIEYRRKLLLEEQEEYLTQDIWQGHLTEHFKEIIIEQLNEVKNIYLSDNTISFSSTQRKIKIGRLTINLQTQLMQNKDIIYTQYSLRIIQKILMTIKMNESTLLVSETGCGKTTLIQYLATLLNKKLYVFNMNLGSDVSDLVGGFKPIDCKLMIKKLLLKFIKYFTKIPTQKNNQKFLNNLLEASEKGEYKRLLISLLKSIKIIKPKINDEKLLQKWNKLDTKLNKIYQNLDKIDNNLVFTFIQGNLLKAIKNGDWILIDQINLAGNQMLQKLVPLINGKSIILYEKGDLKNIKRHQNFRIFSCMNPGNDFGKKPLPKNLLEKFTILTLPEPDKQDVQLFIKSKCPNLNSVQLTKLYFELRKKKTLSLRNLSRALNYINTNIDFYGKRAIYDGLVLGFGEKQLLQNYKNDVSNKKINPEGYVQILGFWVKIGSYPSEQQISKFKLTKKFEQHLMDLLRAISGTNLPVLLQGPTSAGKTSMIRYVAAFSNHKCIRINNHEHTDVQQYLGTYYPNKQGKLIFREGVLVQAVRNGYWLILDQLNLARSQILECLNRLLDDNRELFLPQFQKHIKPHPEFRIFATQNPSSYSGRKNLSKAFKNRFILIEMNQISAQDTIQILAKRVPLVEQSLQIRKYLQNVIGELGKYRLIEKVFIKDAIVTIRDLLKWTQREIKQQNIKENLALEGYTILAERLRTQQQKQYIKKILKKGKHEFNQKQHYNWYAEKEFSEFIANQEIKMNDSFRRMTALTLKAYKNNQPVLLIGQTGCGKTTLAQLLAKRYGHKFFSINCHKHTQASDFIGCLRPSPRNQNQSQNKSIFEYVNGVLINAMLQGGVLLIDQINTAEDSVLQRMNQVFQGGGIGIERGQGWQTIVPKAGFYIIATMNPSGDFGKKQLSPALRNRFTEIWVQPVTHPKYLQDYIKDPVNNDIIVMIIQHLKRYNIQEGNVPQLLFDFVYNFNVKIVPKYGLFKKMITMRDIVWILNFIKESIHLSNNIEERYGWGIWILSIQSLQFYTLSNQTKQTLKKQILNFLNTQIKLTQVNILQILKQMTFPLLITTDLPLKLLNINFESRLFFNPQTELSDLLGQYQPEGKQFIWHNGELLNSVNTGKTIALVDLNLAQQQVVEGINSLFDYRGSIFVVDLDATFHKHKNFRPIVILKNKVQGERKMLPNSFLNRFVKLHLKQFSIQQKISYLHNTYPQIQQILLNKLTNFLTKCKSIGIQVKTSKLELFCQIYVKVQCQKLAVRIAFIDSNLPSVDYFNIIDSVFNYTKTILKINQYEEEFLKELPLIKKQFKILHPNQLNLLLDMYIVYHISKKSIILKGKSHHDKENIIKALSYLVRKHLVQILIANSTDTAELLGSFEQVTQQMEKINLQYSDSFQKFLEIDDSLMKMDESSQQPVFKYLKSRLLVALEKSNNLVYVQLFSDHMVQRIEKGISSIYDHQKKVIIGCQGNRIDSELVQFSYENSTFQSNESVQKNPETVKILNQITKKYISKPNLTNINIFDKFLNLENILAFLTSSKNELEFIKNKERQNQKNFKKAIENVELKNIIQSLQIIQSQFRHEKNDIYDTYALINHRRNQRSNIIKSQIENNLKISYIFNEQYERIFTKLGMTALMPKTLQQYQLNRLVQSLFCLREQEIERNLREFNQLDYIKSKKMIQRFRKLYILNQNNFKVWSIKILKVIRQNQHLIITFEKQINRIYENLQSEYQIVIKQQFEQKIIKNIPVLKCFENGLHYLADSIINQQFPWIDMFRITENIQLTLPSIVEILPPHEQQLFKNMKILTKKLDYRNLGAALSNMSIKNYFIYEKFLEDFYKIQQSNKIQCKKSVEWLLQKLEINIGDLSNQELGILLYKLFRPSQNLDKNISFFVKSDLDYLQSKRFLEQQTIYSQTFEYISQLRYGKFIPSRIKYMHEILRQDQVKLNELKSNIVYRGSDNIQELKKFFNYLNNQIELLQETKFSLEGVSRFIDDLYTSYYLKFNDILFPLFTAAILILDQQKDFSYPCLFNPQINQLEISQLIDLFTQKEQISKFEEDDAKRHILLQRKLHKMIIDQYTKQAQQKHKMDQEVDFQNMFGKGEISKGFVQQSDYLDKIYSKFRDDPIQGYKFALNNLSDSRNLQQFAIVNQFLKKKVQTTINIYEHVNVYYSFCLFQQVTKVLVGIQQLMKQFQTEITKTICLLIHSIFEYKIYKTEVYKILASCQQLVQKMFQLNQTLPKKLQVQINGLISVIIEIRRVEMRNWTQMLELKERKLQKIDLVQFIHLWRMIFKQQQVSKQQIFTLCQKFIRDSNLGTFPLRLKALSCLKQNHKQYRTEIQRIIGYYSYFMDQYKISTDTIRNTITEQIKQYKALAGWNSNEFLILKSTSEKFQRKIHKILKKYEDDLRCVITTVVQTKRQKGLASSFEDYILKYTEDRLQESENQYEELVQDIFNTIQQLKESSHNNQSKLSVLRSFLKQFQQIVPYTINPQSYSPDFSIFKEQSRLKAEKYYYSIWDKLCQRTQATWQRQTIQKAWSIVQNGWKIINTKFSQIKRVQQKLSNKYNWIQSILRQFGWNLQHLNINLQGCHPIFKKQIQALNMIVENERNSIEIEIVNKPQIQNSQEFYSFIKLIHIVSAITLNLEKSGFCTKQQQNQQGGQEGQQFKEGLGMGQGQCDNQAQNVGDEIQFEEQLRGLKNQKQIEQPDIDNKDDQKDFEMEGDFDGEVKSIPSKQQNEEQQKKENDDLDQKFDSVSNKSDFKVDNGQNDEQQQQQNKQREKQEDLEFHTDKKAQQDDQIKAKQQNKAKQNQRNLSQEQFQQEQDNQQGEQNMEGGQKLNEAKPEGEQVEQNQNERSEDHKDIQQSEQMINQDADNMQVQQKSNQQKQNQDDQVQEIQESFEKEVSKNNMDEEQNINQPGQENADKQEEEKPKPKLKNKNKKKRLETYGIQGQEENQLISNQEMEPNGMQQNIQNEQNQGKEQTEDKNTFSKEFLESIISAAKEADQQELRKDLNVIQEALEKNEGMAQEQENAPQNKQEQDNNDYGLANQSNIKTNLTTKNQKQKKQKIQQQGQHDQVKQQNQQEKKDRKFNQKKEQKSTQEQQKEDKNKSKKQKQEKNLSKQLQTQEMTQNQIKQQNPKNIIKTIAQNQMQIQQPVIKFENCQTLLKLQVLKSNQQTLLKVEENIFNQAEHYSIQLYQELKAVLQPLQIASYQGDYKTGKKLNMKKIIPFIASNYRKDRIWLRRAEPTQRNYQINLAIDDTRSMGFNQVGKEALKSMLALALALSRLSIKLSITKIRDTMKILHGFQELFLEQNCKNIIKLFGFDYEDMNSHNLSMAKFMSESINYFKEQGKKNTNNQLHQICFIISDGRFNKEYVKPYIKQAQKHNQTYIFIIIDKKDDKDSILNIRSATLDKNKKVIMKNYMDDFPFEYYLIVKEINELSSILGEVIRQYFEQK